MRFLVSALSITVLVQRALTARAVLSVEASALVPGPGWDVGAASGEANRSANHAHFFAEAIVARAEGFHRRHIRAKAH